MTRYLLLPGMLMVADAILINVAFMAAYVLRYQYEIGREISEENFITLGEYLPLQLSITVVMVVVYLAAGVYRRITRTSLIDDVVKLLSSTSIGMMLILGGIFLTQRYASSRLMLLFIWIGIILVLALARVVKRRLVVATYGLGIGVRTAIVVGNNQKSQMVMHLMATDVGLGYKLYGFVSDGEVEDFGRIRCLGVLDELGDVLDRLPVDEVVISLSTNTHHLAPSIAEQLQYRNVSAKIVPDMYEISLRQVNIDDLRGIPLLALREPRFSATDLLAKRILDVTVSIIGLILLSPIWTVVAIAIKTTSPGPILFSQQRVGRDGALFKIYKFRSMRHGADLEREELQNESEVDGPIFKIRRDRRRTPVGTFIRRTSIDETPQLLNILFGSMSLVGPRPLIPEEVQGHDEWARKRLKVTPGLTGLWQVSGRSDLSFDEMVLLDIYYIENWTIWLDIKILLRTLPAVLSGRGAY